MFSLLIFVIGCLFFVLEDMESKELNLNKEYACETSETGGDGFIDRSKVRILLCDNDSTSSEEVFSLLVKCSYQGMYWCYSSNFSFELDAYLG